MLPILTEILSFRQNTVAYLHLYVLLMDDLLSQFSVIVGANSYDGAFRAEIQLPVPWELCICDV